MSSALAQLAVSKRLTIVSKIGTPADGESLAGQNVNDFPAGALFYVEQSNRFYVLRKNLDSAVVASNLENVVDGIGSSAAAGRFVAVQQFAAVTLLGGTATVSGFDLERGGAFLVSLQTPGGTTGFVHAVKTTNTTATVTSSNGADTGSYTIVFVEQPAST